MRVIHVDDDPADRALVRRALEQGLPDIDLVQAANGRDLAALLDGFEPDVAVLDYSLGWSNGVEVMRVIRDIYPDVSVALFTGSLGEENAVEVMRAGIDDYIVKEHGKLPRLVASIESLCRRTAERRARRRTEARHQALWRAGSVGLLTVAAQGRIVDANPAARVMLGLSPESIGAVNLLDLVSADGLAEAWTRPGGAAIASMEVSLGEDRAALLDAHMTDARGEHVECVLTDVTALRNAVRHAEIAVREVYHRVYNNLQVIDALLNLQARKHDDRAVRADFLDVSQRVRALAMVQQRLHRGDDFSSVDFAGYLRDLAAAMSATDRRPDVLLRVEAPERLTMAIDRAIPLGLIVTELITNALKHAFPEDRGHVRVSVVPGQAGALVLHVADDGVGSTRPLFRGGEGSGVGTKILLQLASQVGAVLRQEEGAGTSVCLDVPGPGGHS